MGKPPAPQQRVALCVLISQGWGDQLAQLDCVGSAASMASYHFSASVVKRAAGRSAVAAAAYRAGERLEDQRYGETHDYTRKGGVLHSEIITPNTAPDWMHDRAQLWNAVENIETRKNAQLARDITLALPHELTDAQRLDLVRSFVKEQFIERGMIADIAIHAPHRQGDDRNHHAHVMLTMRELLGDGFNPKKATPEARRWNEIATLENWREAWANHQNRAFEHIGSAARVDHRSYEAQGVDREPTQHEGAKATAMRRRGEETRIGSENDRRNAANDNRARLEAALAGVQEQIAYERLRFAEWRLRAEAALDSRQQEDRAQLANRHNRETSSKERDLKKSYSPAMQKHRTAAKALQDRVQQGGLRGFIRRVTGAQEADKQALAGHARSLKDAKQRVNEQREALAKKQEAARAAFEAKQAKEREQQRERLDKAAERKARELQEQQRIAEAKVQKEMRPRDEAEKLQAVEQRQQEREARRQNSKGRGRSR